jgi:hypothetical protein
MKNKNKNKMVSMYDLVSLDFSKVKIGDCLTDTDIGQYLLVIEKNKESITLQTSTGHKYILAKDGFISREY